MGSIFTEINKAEYTLATHPGPIKERLIAAFGNGIIGVSEESLLQLPADIKDKCKDLYRRLTLNDDTRGDEGRIHATVRNMSEEDAVKIAGEIRSLTYQVAQLS